MSGTSSSRGGFVSSLLNFLNRVGCDVMKEQLSSSLPTVWRCYQLPARNPEEFCETGRATILKRWHLSLALLIAAILLVFYVPASGQSVNATLLGTVADSSGAAVAAAKVDIREVNTGITRTGETNESGNYIFSDLAPGRYEVSAGKTGFKRVIHDAVDVLVNTTIRVDLRLEPGTI